MIEITFLGRIVAVLSSKVALVCLLMVFLASAYVLSTAAAAIVALPKPKELAGKGLRDEKRDQALFWSSGLALIVATGVVFSSFSLGSAAPSLLFALSVGALCRSTTRVLVGLLMRASDVQEGRRLRRLAAAQAKQAQMAQAQAKMLAGVDLQAEVRDADASLERLREALSNLRDTRAALGQKLGASMGTSAPSKLDPDVVKLRDELGLRIGLGERVLAAAEAAAFRLACAVPIKKLVRRRPEEVVALNPRGPGDLAGRVERAMGSIDKYIESIREARTELDEIAQRRPTLPPPGEDEIADAKQSKEPTDPLERASREIDVIEQAYRGLRGRLELFRLGLQAKTGMAEVATAATGVGAQAAKIGLSEQELGQLLADLARAERATALELPVDDDDLRALAEVLTRGTNALDQDDRASLGEVVTALGELG